eukprot:g16237.t1
MLVYMCTGCPNKGVASTVIRELLKPYLLRPCQTNQDCEGVPDSQPCDAFTCQNNFCSVQGRRAECEVLCEKNAACSSLAALCPQQAMCNFALGSQPKQGKCSCGVTCGDPVWTVRYQDPGTCSSTAPGDTCKPRCGSGFQGSLAGTMLCGEDGQWSGFTGCEVMCASPIWNARFQDPGNCASNARGATCTPVCGAGFRGSPAATITCENTGTWSAFTGCDVLCGLPAWNSRFTAPGPAGQCGSSTAGATCTPVCGAGYNGSPAAAINCTQDGSWTAFSGCQGQDAGPWQSLTNCGTPAWNARYRSPVNGCGTTTGSRCTPQCGTGYTGSPAGAIECQAGIWTSFSGCELVCAAPQWNERYLNPGNCQLGVGQLCQPRCGAGYSGSPAQPIECLRSGAWSTFIGCEVPCGSPVWSTRYTGPPTPC